MKSRTLLISCCLAFSVTVLAGAFSYGPSRRIFVSPGMVTRAAEPPEILQRWEAAGIRGRIAVVFTRRLNAVEPQPDGSETKYLQTAMHRGLVRKVFHVVPDSAWGEVSCNLAGSRRTSSGFLLLHDEGRVHVMPLSRFERLEEPALVVIDPSNWTPADLQGIRAMLAERRVVSDYVTIVNGTDSDFRTFGQPPLRR